MQQCHLLQLLRIFPSVFAWCYSGSLGPMPVDYCDILNGYNLPSRLGQSLYCRDSCCIEAIYSQPENDSIFFLILKRGFKSTPDWNCITFPSPDSSNAEATQSLTHVQSSHLRVCNHRTQPKMFQIACPATLVRFFAFKNPCLAGVVVQIGLPSAYLDVIVIFHFAQGVRYML